MELVSKLPKIGSSEMVAQVNILKGVTKKVDDTLEIYHFFIDGSWNFENKKIA
jgi:hypothetical protein